MAAERREVILFVDDAVAAISTEHSVRFRKKADGQIAPELWKGGKPVGGPLRLTVIIDQPTPESSV